MITDKRVLKTRTAIKKAFMQLALEKETSKITVSNVTDRAQINRSTFYLHYSDVNAVMKDIEKEIEETIAACVNGFDIDTVYESTLEMFTKLTDALNGNENLQKYLFESTSSDYLMGRLKEILIENARSLTSEKVSGTDKSKLIYPLTFAAGGIIDTYVKWVHSDDGSTSLEELIRTISALVRNTVEYVDDL